MARILIVDDSPTDLRVLSGMLERNGHQVTVAMSADEGLARARHDQPDLILMDVIMPGMNGFQATRALSRDPATAGIPIIIVTTKSMESDRQWGLRQGARDYVVKPVKAEDLLAKIKALG